jgi:hypothetical protein
MTRSPCVLTRLASSATDRERQNLYRVRDALKLRTTDAVWLLLMALQHYETLYEEVPGRIVAVARDVTREVRRAAEAEAQAAQADTQRALMSAVREAATKSAEAAAGTHLVKWVSVGVGVASVALVLVSWSAYRRGQETGLAVGKERARQECGVLVAASAWARTPDGQLAYELARVGGLRDVARCEGRGMSLRAESCIVASERGKVLARWPVPSTSSNAGGGSP